MKFASRSHSYFAVGFTTGDVQLYGSASTSTSANKNKASIGSSPSPPAQASIVDLCFSSHNNFLASCSIDRTCAVYLVDIDMNTNTNALKHCRTISVNGFPMSVMYPPPTSQFNQGSHDEVYFVCLSKSFDNSTRLEAIDGLKGDVVECLESDRMGMGMGMGSHTRNRNRSRNSIKSIAFKDDGKVIFLSVENNGGLHSCTFDYEARHEAKEKIFGTLRSLNKSSANLPTFAKFAYKRMDTELFCPLLVGVDSNNSLQIARLDMVVTKKKKAVSLGASLIKGGRSRSRSSAGGDENMVKATWMTQPFLPKFQMNIHSCVAVSTMTNAIITGGRDGVLNFWDVHKAPGEQCLFSTQGMGGGVSALDWSGDDCCVVSGDVHGTIIICDIT